MNNTEAIKSKESINKEPRFLVLGTRTAGSQKIAEVLRAATKEIPDSQVDVVRDVKGIEDMFYGRFEEPIRETHYKGGLPRRIGAAMLGRKPRITGWTQTPVRSEGPDTLPEAVIVLPEMRQRGPTGHGMTIPTPFERIQELCEQNSVPMTLVEAQPSSERIAELASELTAR